MAALFTPASAERPGAIPADTLPATLELTKVPLGLEARPVAADNVLTKDRVRLGRKLFFDPILSADGTVACASCHRPDKGFSAGDAHAVGIKGERTRRRPPTLFNRAYGKVFFWDGREASLESQALRPIEDPAEMGSTLADALKRLKAHADYPALFAKAYDDGLNAANIGKALASFERVLVRGDSPIDQFRRQGKRSAMTSEELHGLWLYESKGRCWNCHSGPNFTDEAFHNTGVSWGNESLDLGRFRVTAKDADKGKFKTPTLRGVKLTAPYMHNGSMATLKDVVEFYNQGGSANPNKDPILEKLNLTVDEINDLVAFLKAL